jgi:hypothetical protein
MRRLSSVSVLVLALGLAACSLSLRGQPAAAPARAPAASWPAEADTAVRAAVQDVAAKLQVQSAAVQVISVSATDWSDTSLGCPQPGMFYAQMIVQGYAITLAAGDRQVEYHADKKGRVVTCRNP